MSKEEIEYVELRLKVPKAIVDFLRAHETDLGESVEEYLEYIIVDGVNARIDANDDWTLENPQSPAKGWGLEKVFKEILFPPEVMERARAQLEEYEKMVAKGIPIEQIIAHLERKDKL